MASEQTLVENSASPSAFSSSIGFDKDNFNAYVMNTYGRFTIAI